MSSQRIIKIFLGLLFGGVFGLSTVTIFAILYSFIASLLTSTPENGGISDTIFMVGIATLMITFLFGLTAIVIGGIVGAANGAIDGGIGAGIECILIASSASVLGTWYWQFQISSYWLFGVMAGLIGGLVGFLTWKYFRTTDAPNTLSAINSLSYFISFVLISFASPMTMELMIFIFD